MKNQGFPEFTCYDGQIVFDFVEHSAAIDGWKEISSEEVPQEIKEKLDSLQAKYHKRYDSIYDLYTAAYGGYGISYALSIAAQETVDDLSRLNWKHQKYYKIEK